MHDATSVRSRQPAGDLSRDLEGVARRQVPPLDPSAQRLALEQLRDQVQTAAVLADVVDHEQIGVIQRARRASLRLEAAPPLGIVAERLQQHLDGDLAAEPVVPRAVDLAHATRAQRADDHEGPDVVSR